MHKHVCRACYIHLPIGYRLLNIVYSRCAVMDCAYSFVLTKGDDIVSGGVKAAAEGVNAVANDVKCPLLLLCLEDTECSYRDAIFSLVSIVLAFIQTLIFSVFMQNRQSFF